MTALAQQPLITTSRRVVSWFPSIADTVFSFHQPGGFERVAVEEYIRAKFKRIYGARILHFLPYLLSLRYQDNLSAVVGIRAAESGPLFLEQYLDQPVEQALGLHFREVVDRGKIVEIGNLVSGRNGSSQSLFIFLTALLDRIQREWVIFTATWEVEKLLGKLNIPLIKFAEAEQDRLKKSEEYWGSYYDNNPYVMFVHVPSALNALRENEFAAASLKIFSNDLTLIAGYWERRNA